MKLFDAGMILILLTTFNSFYARDCLQCLNNCGFNYEKHEQGESTFGNCDSETDSFPCNGSCSGEFQTTSLDKNFPGRPYLKAFIHMSCSPQKFEDSCVPTTSEKYEGVTQRCFCNSDDCYYFKNHGIF